MTINFLALLLCGVWSMVAGFLWYSPVMFAKPWMKLSGIDPKMVAKMDNRMMMKMYGATFLLNLLAAFLLGNYFIGRPNTIGLNLFLVGVWWFIFTLVPFITTNAYSNKPFKLTLINAGYQLVSFLGFAVIFTFL